MRRRRGRDGRLDHAALTCADRAPGCDGAARGRSSLRPVAGDCGAGPARRHDRRRFRLSLSRRLAQRLEAERAPDAQLRCARALVCRRFGDPRRLDAGRQLHPAARLRRWVDAGRRRPRPRAWSRRVALQRHLRLRLRRGLRRLAGRALECASLPRARLLRPARRASSTANSTCTFRSMRRAASSPTPAPWCRFAAPPAMPTGRAPI